MPCTCLRNQPTSGVKSACLLVPRSGKVAMALKVRGGGQAEAVAKLVLVDAQGFIDGIGPMSKAPRFLASLGVQVHVFLGLGL